MILIVNYLRYLKYNSFIHLRAFLNIIFLVRLPRPTNYSHFLWSSGLRDTHTPPEYYDEPSVDQHYFAFVMIIMPTPNIKLLIIQVHSLIFYWDGFSIIFFQFKCVCIFKSSYERLKRFFRGLIIRTVNKSTILCLRKQCRNFSRLTKTAGWFRCLFSDHLSRNES